MIDVSCHFFAAFFSGRFVLIGFKQFRIELTSLCSVLFSRKDSGAKKFSNIMSLLRVIEFAPRLIRSPGKPESISELPGLSRYCYVQRRYIYASATWCFFKFFHLLFT